MAGIFKKSKRLEDVLEKQMELNCKIGDKLKIAGRSLSEYQRFLDFIDEKVEKNGWQLYGIKKHKDDQYIAYFLESKLEEEPQYRYNYNIYAYSSLSFDTPVYKAYLGWCFKERFTVGRVLHIDNHYVTSKNLQGQGIGTESMNIIKSLAKQLQCDGIQGTKSEIIDDNVFITTMVTLFHESRHMENYLQQYRFTRDNPEECRQMALSYLVRQGSDISYLSNYYSDPIEIDAEEFGVLSAYYYLQKNYPNLEYEQLILNYVNDRACDSNYYFFSIPKGSALTSIEEVENAYNTAFSESKNKAKSYDERVFPSKSNIRCLVDKRLVMDECWLARAHIEGTKNHEANKMIASLILHHYPEYLKKLPSLRNIDFTPEHYFDKDMLPDVLMKRSPISQLKSKILQAKNNEQEIDGSER